MLDRSHQWSPIRPRPFSARHLTMNSISLSVHVLLLLLMAQGEESAQQRRRLRFNPWSGKIPEEDNGWLQYSRLENPICIADWRTIVHGVTNSRIQLSDWTTIVCCYLSSVNSFCLPKNCPFHHCQIHKHKTMFLIFFSVSIDSVV